MGKKAPTVRYILVGDDHCGKSTLLSGIEDDPMSLPNQKHAKIDIRGKEVDVIIHNTGGSAYEVYCAQLAFEFKADCVFLIFSITKPETLENVQKVWLDIVKEHCKRTPIILVGNKKDLRGKDLSSDEDEGNVDEEGGQEEAQVPKEQFVPMEKGMEMAARIGACEYIEISAYSSNELWDLFKTAAMIASKKRKGEGGCIVN